MKAQMDLFGKSMMKKQYEKKAHKKTAYKKTAGFPAAVTAILIAMAVISAAALFGCGNNQAKSSTIYGYFDTVTTVTGYDSAADFAAATDLVEEELQYWHQLTDIYHEYSGITNAYTLNERAGEEKVEVTADLFALLSFGKEMYDLTDGECNIAMGAVLQIWHEKREAALSGGSAELPSDEALQAAAMHCDMEKLLLDAEEFSVFFADAELRLDLGAVAKGYAAERIAEKLEAAGFSGYALSLGGNVRVIGTKPGGAAWISGIENPDTSAEEAYVETVPLTDEALVTSGSYQRYYEVDGVRYHHIISPETLYPKNEFLSVSVRCPDSGMADALSTALFNMPLSAGQALIESLPDTSVWWILPDGGILCAGE